MAKFQQPWSIAFLPDGNIFVTERPGRLRIIRNGVLDPNPVRGGALDPATGRPRVHAQGLQGLMDVVLHPRFAENKWVYIAYHKPVPNPDAPPNANGAPAMAGETTLMRGTWNGTALVDVKDIFRVRRDAHRVVADRIRPRRHALHDDQRVGHGSGCLPLRRSERLRREDRAASG